MGVGVGTMAQAGVCIPNDRDTRRNDDAPKPRKAPASTLAKLPPRARARAARAAERAEGGEERPRKLCWATLAQHGDSNAMKLSNNTMCVA